MCQSLFLNKIADLRPPIKSSKEEIDLSRDSKELFEQRFVKVFDQNRKRGRREI